MSDTLGIALDKLRRRIAVKVILTEDEAKALERYIGDLEAKAGTKHLPGPPHDKALRRPQKRA